MTELTFAILVASTLLFMAALISLIPVATIQRRFKKQKSENTTSAEAHHFMPRNEIVSTLMKTYLHDRVVRDQLQNAATAQNLHPVDAHDVLAQLIFVRRDLNRIMHEANLRVQSTNAFTAVYRSNYFHSSHEALIPRGEIGTARYIHNVELSEDLNSAKKRKSRPLQ